MRAAARGSPPATRLAFVPPLPVHVAGRVAHDADGSLRLGWPALYVDARFRGPAIRVRFDAPTDF